MKTENPNMVILTTKKAGLVITEKKKLKTNPLYSKLKLTDFYIPIYTEIHTSSTFLKGELLHWSKILPTETNPFNFLAFVYFPCHFAVFQNLLKIKDLPHSILTNHFLLMYVTAAQSHC